MSMLKMLKWTTRLGLLLAAAICVSANCGSADLGTSDGAALVTGVEVVSDNEVIIMGQGALDGHAFLLSEDPPKIAVDITNAALAEDAPSTVVGAGAIDGVDLAKLDLEPPAVRVIVNLDRDMVFELTSRGSDLALKLTPSPEPLIDNSIPYEEAMEEAERVRIGAPPPPLPPMPVVNYPAVATDLPPPPFLREMPPPAADGSATVVGDILVRNQEDAVQIMIYTNGPVRNFLDFDIQSEAKIVVDLWGLELDTRKKSYPVNWSGVRQVRLGQHHDKVRAVIDFSGKLRAYDVTPTPTGVVVTVYRNFDYAPGGVRSQLYSTRPGDSLRSLAQEFYGNPDNWPRLLSANRRFFTKAEIQLIEDTNGAVELGDNLPLTIPTR